MKTEFYVGFWARWWSNSNSLAVKSMGRPSTTTERLSGSIVIPPALTTAFAFVITVLIVFAFGGDGVLAPSGTPSEVLDKLYGETVKALAMPDVRRKFDELGLEPVGNSPSEFAAVIQMENPK